MRPKSVHGIYGICPQEKAKMCRAKEATGSASGRGHTYNWRKGTRILKRALPLPTGEVETFFTTMRMKTNIVDGNDASQQMKVAKTMVQWLRTR